MKYLYEESDFLNRPFEVFLFDTAVNAFPVSSHWHHYVEVIYVLEGNIFVSSNEKEYYLDTDDMFLFHQGDVHSLYSTTNAPAKFMVIKFDAGRLSIRSSYTPRFAYLLKRVRSESEELMHFKAADNIERNLRSRFMNLYEEMNNKQIGYDVLIHFEISSIMVEMLRMWENGGVNLDVTDVVINEDEITLQAILEYMDSHLTEKITVESLAKRCNMSYSHFSKRFKEVYGRSCKNQLELLRIERAEEMLKTTESSLDEISQELCFSDCSHFIRTFKKWKGLTPGRYRK